MESFSFPAAREEKPMKRVISRTSVSAMEEYSFWMPDYYPSFACKMGLCRSACCSGWPVSFSLEDYFRLINSDCGPSLREKLDRGVRIELHPTPERYAAIQPRFDGSCPIRLPDGRCAIHAELGEAALSDVCRLYPRGVRLEDEGCEISCANSCEAVLELFLARREPIGFTTEKLGMKLPPMGERTFFFNTHGHGREIRLSLIRTMQDRRCAIPERLILLERRLAALESAMRSGEDALREWLAAPQCDIPALPTVGPKQLEEGLRTAEKLIGLVDDRSVSVRAYGEEALACFGGGDGAFDRYAAAKERFEEAFPDRELFFEHMLVNHMFFTCFPFEDRAEGLREEFMAICAVYTLLRFLAVGCSKDRARREDYIDVFAAAFRLIDHTAFDIYVSHILEEMGWTTDGELTEWIIL